MAWFEEWFLYFQWEWERESTTLPLLKDLFKTSDSMIRRVLRQKLNTVLEARNQAMAKIRDVGRRCHSDVLMVAECVRCKENNLVGRYKYQHRPAARDVRLNRHTYSA